MDCCSVLALIRQVRDASRARATEDLIAPSTLGVLACAAIILFCPILSVLLHVSLEDFNGSISSVLGILRQSPKAIFEYLPHLHASSLGVVAGYYAWIGFQAVLYRYLPGPISKGQLTPAGHILSYRTNGLLALFTTISLALILHSSGLVSGSLIADHWYELVLNANVMGFLLSIAAFCKAYLAPSFPGDQSHSGNTLYDFYMGIELNPRVGWLDLKFFFNERPGMVGWLLIDLSFIAKQHQLHGYTTASIWIATFFHALYVFDLFINEAWYLQTIDIAHDQYGFYLAWGSAVWLPATYTLQTQYLARNPVQLSPGMALLITALGISGYVLFRLANDQRWRFRQSRGQCTIWGKGPKYLTAPFKTADGKMHESLLLCSGWWGIARHANYSGDLILSFAMCATCGTKNLLPWTYFIFMSTILIHRCIRDEQRCHAKYGKVWESYCEIVPWRLLPGVF